MINASGRGRDPGERRIRGNTRLCHSRPSFVYFSPPGDAAAVIRLRLPGGYGGNCPPVDRTLAHSQTSREEDEERDIEIDAKTGEKEIETKS